VHRWVPLTVSQNINLSILQQEEDSSSRIIVGLTNALHVGSYKIKMIYVLLIYINKVYLWTRMVVLDALE